MTDNAIPIEAKTDQSTELAALARMLRRSNGQFALAFAKCNSPAQRQNLVATLSDTLAAISVTVTEVTVSGSGADIYAELAAAPNPGAPLFVYGLEQLMPSDILGNKPSAAQYRALAQLNERRGRYQNLARPLVFWVPEYALRLIAEVAGDFWAWRSGVFEFATEETLVRETFQREAALPFMEMTNLTAAEKRSRIHLLTALLDDYEGDRSLESLRAALNATRRLGQLREELGEYGQAEKLYREYLKIAEQSGDKRGVAVTQHSLGQLARLRGDYEQAEQLYRASLKTKEELGDKREVAITQGNLGQLARLRGDYEQAEQLCRASLKTFEELDDKRGIAVTQGNLGQLAELRGDYEQAEQLYRASLKTFEELGDKRGVAVMQGNLGQLAQQRGDYEQAGQLYRASLKTKEELGDKRGVAITQDDLGQLAQQRGDYEQAEQLYRASLKTKEELGDKREVAITQHNLAYLKREQGQHTQAIELLIRSRDLFHQIGLEKDAMREEELIQEIQSQLAQETFNG